jgi:predicted DNA-binding transcriptional regulator YafY
MSDSLRRQITMLNHVPRFPRCISTAELASRLERDGYATTMRTVQRDLNKLAQDFPLESDGAKPQGWRWRQGAVINTFGMDAHAALTFGLVEQYLQPLLPKTTLSHLAPWFNAAALMREWMDPKLQLWQKCVRVLPMNTNTVPPASNPAIQDTVYEALLNNKQINITYKAITGDGNAKTYPVHPWGLLIKDSSVYLVGSAKSYDQARLFHLHRIEEAEPLEDPAYKPEDFDIDRFIAQEWGIKNDPQAMRVKIAVSPLIAKYLQESPMPEQRLICVGDVMTTFEFKAQYSERFRAWLLSLGADAHVLSPAELRKEISQSVKAMASLYTE